MKYLIEIIQHTTMFAPHGMCYMWNPAMVTAQVVSNATIGLSYLAIAVTLIFIIRQREDWKFNVLFWVSSAFIAWCAMTHFMEIILIWFPIYWIDVTIRTVTAMISLVAAVMFFKMAPGVLQLPNFRRLQDEHYARIRAEEALRQANLQLNQRVRERTQKLEDEIKTLRLGLITSTGASGMPDPIDLFNKLTASAERIESLSHDMP